ncbi:MAG: choice-of-anchor D domain-containing protein, partial [Candidatus Binatus sp.]
MRGLVPGAAALIAVISGADIIGHAAGSPAPIVARALEPGFTGTFLYRNDNFRTGQNLAESVLTPSNVNASQFGLQFTDAIDGAAYAEPLYVPNVAIPSQGTHNVVYVATENDTVYAFDADQAGPPLWHTSFIDPSIGITAVPSTDIGGCIDLTPIIGITATPVIDPATGTLYVVSKVKLGPGNYQQQLHALDITTGLERANSPVTITASVPGTARDAVRGVVTFDPLLQQDRPALTLANGVVYLSFASHCDVQPYHGWILGYDETLLTQMVVYNTTPKGDQGGIWQSGCGPGVDTNGDLIAITGNGSFDTSASSRANYGDSFLRLTPGGGSMSISSFFTPLNELVLDDEDLDMGSGGNLLLPDQPGPNPHLMIGAGKVGTLYLVNRDSMGGFNASTDQMVQELPSAVGGMFSTPAYWQGTVPGVGLQNMLYTIGETDEPKMFVIANGLIQTPPVAAGVASLFAYPGASPVISANGTTGGVLWAINNARWQSNGPATLIAFDATNLQMLYTSDQHSSDNPGPAVKFTVPTVANGSVYVGTQTQLAAFGLLSAGGTPTPTTTATATITSTQTMTGTPSATISATPTVTATTDVTATPTVTASITATPTETPTPGADPTPVFATLNASPKSVSFSKQVVGRAGKAATITVINTAAQTPVTLSQPTVSSGFVVTSSNCPAVLQPGASCAIQVASVPSSKGMQIGQLHVNSNAKYGLHTVKLKGKGLAPKIKTKPKSLRFRQEAATAAA